MRPAHSATERGALRLKERTGSLMSDADSVGTERPRITVSLRCPLLRGSAGLDLTFLVERFAGTGRSKAGALPFLSSSRAF